MKYVLRILVLGIAMSLLFMAGCRQLPPSGQRSLGMLPGPVKGEPTIRVWWLESAAAIDLIVPGEYTLTVTELDGKSRTGGGKQPLTITVAPFTGGIQLGRNQYKNAEIAPVSGQLRVRYTSGGKRVERTLPGSFIFSSTDQGALLMALRLPLEQYLTGVLPSEMPLSAPPAALQAQAVAARTYALYELRSSARRPFDVYPDTRSQVWSPEDANDTRSRMAVNSTHGIVLTENNLLFPTYFHSDCGGRTANGRIVFSSATNTVLSGVECPHGPDSSKWTFTITKEDLSARLAKAGISNGNILRIAALDEKKEPMSVFGRVYHIRLYLDNGVVRTIPVRFFRGAVGAGTDELSSTMFAIDIKPNGTIVFGGRGFGHGVGLCQHGAMYMARGGDDYQTILRHYYPGAVLLRLW